MQMVLVKANRLYLYAGHTSHQLRQYLYKIAAHSRIQDPSAVFAHPHYVILQVVDTVSCLYYFHTSSIPPTGSFIHG
jgi:hypothetical protein